MKIFLTLAAFFLCSVCSQAANPKIIAHRGYWKADGSAQNSIRALVKADSIGAFGSEFDVWMTTDGVLFVNHNRDINGVIIENSTSGEVKDQLLPNGEKIPTLEQYLEAAQGLDTRLICELKEHDSRTREKKAVKDILDMVKRLGLEDRTDYITFSKNAFKDFVKLAPKQCGVYYLDGDYVPAQIKETGGAGIDYSLRAIKKHPEWIEESHRLGLLVNIWTVDDEADMIWCIDNGADFITTNKPEELNKILQSR